jgi:hypothetical protein
MTTLTVPGKGPPAELNGQSASEVKGDQPQQEGSDSADATGPRHEVEGLIRKVHEAKDDAAAAEAIESLAKRGGGKAVSGLIDVMKGKSCKDEDRSKAAAVALARYQLKECSRDLVDLLRSTPLKGPGITGEDPAPRDVRLGLAEELTKRDHSKDLRDYRIDLGHALVASEDPELRARIANLFAKLSTGWLPEWEDALIVDVGPSDDEDGEHLWAAWQIHNPQVTSVPDPITAQPLEPDPDNGGPRTFTIPLPTAGQNLLGPRVAGGAPAAIRLTVKELS